MTRPRGNPIAPLLASILALGLAAAPAQAITRRSIAVDGDLSDWSVVLRDASNLVTDLSKIGGDPDVPGTADRDLRLLAVTWDAANLYFYLRRTDSGSNSVDFVLYVDLDDDQLLGPSDLVLDLQFNGNVFKSASAYRYVPAASPADPVTGDGQDEPGGVGAAVATDLIGRGGPVGDRFEARVSWASLGVAPGSPLTFHASVSTGTNLPSQVQDNSDPLSTRFWDLALLADGTRRSPSPGTIGFPHLVTATGNKPDRINLSASSTRAFQLELYTDPDGDGNPADGRRMALDLDGNGVYTDPGDSIDPAFDQDGNGLPDTGMLAAGAGFRFLVLATVPAGVPNGTEDRIRVSAASASTSAAFAVNLDTLVVGTMTISPDRAHLAVAGDTVWHQHHVCNFSLLDDSVSLAATSLLGWTTTIHTDPNGDGNPVDGQPITRTPIIPRGTCISVVLAQQVPAAQALGTVDTARLTGALGRNPAVVDDAIDTTTVSPPVRFAPDSSGLALPGGAAFYPATITNATNTSANFDLTATTTLGSLVRFWTDPDRDGEPDDGVPILIAGPVASFGGSIGLVVEVVIPTSATQGAVDTTVGRATLLGNPTLLASVTETTAVRDFGTFSDPAYQRFSTVFPRCATVYARVNNLTINEKYRFEWYDSTGLLRRIFPNDARGTSPDALGQLDDQFTLALGDPIGVWQVNALRKTGNGFEQVDPGGTGEFRVTDDRNDEGGIISYLAADKLDYSSSGENLTVSAIFQNPSPIAYTNSHADYLLYLDADGSTTPDPGETYLTAAGVPATFAAGDFTCRTFLPEILPGGEVLDTSCQVTNMQFPAPLPAVWSLHAAWMTQCNAEVSVQETYINVGCQPADKPLADAGTDQEVCRGGSVTIGTPGQTGMKYLWTPLEFLSSRTDPQPVATPPITVEYHLAVVNPATSCANSDTVRVTVHPLPAPSAGADRIGCGGAPVQIGTDPGPLYRCRWTPTAGLSPSATACQPMAAPATTTVYEVTWTELATGCEGTDAVNVEVFSPLPLADAGPDASVCLGSAGTRIGTPALPGFVYLWSPTRGLADPGFAETLAYPIVDTLYTLTVIDARSGCQNTDAVQVTVAPRPGPVSRLLAAKAGATLADVHMEWTARAEAAGGYRAYFVTLKTEIPGAQTSLDRIDAFTVPPPQLTGEHAGAVPGPAGELFYYQLVGLCADGFEGLQ